MQKTNELAPDLLEKSADQASVQPKFISWGLKSGTAVVDQALITGSNFVVNILLARWLVPEKYGAYAVGFSVLILVLMLYQSLILEPMSVFGAAVYRNCIRKYMKILLVFHAATGVVIFLATSASAGVMFMLNSHSSLPATLVGVGVAAPCILLLWLVRRMFYLEFMPLPSAAAASIYLALILGGLILIYRNHLLSPLSAFLLMGAAALVTSALLLVQLNFRLRPGLDSLTLRDAWRRHWHYGRWSLGSSAVAWVPNYMFYPLVSVVSGMPAAGDLKALMNLAAPVLQGYAALFTLFLPYAARVHERKGFSGTYTLMRRITGLSIIGAILYWSPVLIFKLQVFRLLYSGGYIPVLYLLPLVALASISWSAFLGPATALRAMESPSTVFTAVCVSSCISVIVAIPAIKRWGVTGALIGIIISEALAFVLALWLLRSKMSKTSHPPAISPVFASGE